MALGLEVLRSVSPFPAPFPCAYQSSMFVLNVAVYLRRFWKVRSMRVRADAHVRVDAGSEDWKAHAGYMNAREKFQGLVSSGSLIFGEIPAAGKEGAHPTGGRRACPRPPQRHRRVSVQNPFRSGTARPLQCASCVMGTGGGSAFPPVRTWGEDAPSHCVTGRPGARRCARGGRRVAGGKSARTAVSRGPTCAFLWNDLQFKTTPRAFALRSVSGVRTLAPLTSPPGLSQG